MIGYSPSAVHCRYRVCGMLVTPESCTIQDLKYCHAMVLKIEPIRTTTSSFPVLMAHVSWSRTSEEQYSKNRFFSEVCNLERNEKQILTQRNFLITWHFILYLHRCFPDTLVSPGIQQIYNVFQVDFERYIHMCDQFSYFSKYFDGKNIKGH